VCASQYADLRITVAAFVWMLRKESSLVKLIGDGAVAGGGMLDDDWKGGFASQVELDGAHGNDTRTRVLRVRRFRTRTVTGQEAISPRYCIYVW
jgi:hypothetical protein